MYAVAKPFKTINRKFAIDDSVTPSDILPENPMTFADLKDRGFIRASRVDYDTMNRAELDALAAERKVDVSAAKSKADVIAALEHAEKVDEAIQSDDLDLLLKSDLEQLARSRGLDISEAKTKADLIDILHANSEAADVHHDPAATVVVPTQV